VRIFPYFFRKRLTSVNIFGHKPIKQGLFKGNLGFRFGSIEFKIGSLESEKIIIGSLEFKIVSLQVHTRYLIFSFKKTALTNLFEAFFV